MSLWGLSICEKSGSLLYPKFKVMKIDLRDISNGGLQIDSLRKVVEQLTSEKNPVEDKILTIKEAENKLIIPINESTTTRILLEILGYVKNIDANVQKLVNQTK